MCKFNADTCQSLSDVWGYFLNNHTWIVFLVVLAFLSLQLYRKKFGRQISDDQLIGAYIYAVKVGKIK
ncbi:MAG TPA: hypothetical protein PKI14_01560 [Fervidobacterium sp.]|nr:hypothetical protein [Fervidobacterium sp.]